MQKGFATLEVILVIFIISVLMTCAVPNAARIIDKVSLDYETKRLYSDLRFVQALNRSGTVKNTGMNGIGIDSSPPATIILNNPTDIPKGWKADGWKITLGAESNAPTIRETHYLSYGVKLSSPNFQINFDSDGKSNINSNHLLLTSRSNKYSSKIIFDSVGRFHGEK